MVWVPRVVVIGPGSSKIMKILGFLVAMEEHNVLDKVDTYCGVGSGAVIALLSSIGYNVKNIINIIVTKSVLFDIESYTGIIEVGKNDIIRRRLTELVIDKCGTIPNLHNLYLQTGIACNFITYNETTEEEVLLGPFNDGKISCIDACLLSMNVPYSYYKLRHNSNVYVDGCLANPYPISYFDHNQTNILGIYTKSLPKSISILESEEEKTLTTQWHNIIQTMIYQHTKHLIGQASDHCVHICIETSINNIASCVTPNIEELQDSVDSKLIVAGYNFGLEVVDAIMDGMYHSQISYPDTYIYPTYYKE